MSDVENRYAMWPNLVAELVTSPTSAEFPRAAVELALLETFQCQVVWNWRDADGSNGFELALGPPLEARSAQVEAELELHGGLDNHPLIRWGVHTGDTRAMSVGRVPRSIAPPDCIGLLHDLLAPHDYEQQLAIPFRMKGQEHRTYVLARGVQDFSDDDVELARRIQPLLELLDRQVLILEQRRASTAGQLTGRELAALTLLADGLTAGAIAHRLGVSPRTVNKHLEHLYRKLDVRDRLQAVLVARDAGLLEPPPAPEDPPIVRPTGRSRGGVMAR